MIKTNLQEQTTDGKNQNNPVSNYIEKLKTELMEKREAVKQSRLYASLTYSEFIEIFKLIASRRLADKNEFSDFIVDRDNVSGLKQLYGYLTGNKEYFKGNPFKGIILIGKIGVGKTLMMSTYIEILEKTIFKNIKIQKLHSKQIASKLINKDFGSIARLEKAPLFIDDIGKESREVNDFGTIISPITDLFSIRYDNNAKTFATANYSKDTFKKFYGSTIADRFIEMFNVIRIDGDESRRI